MNMKIVNCIALLTLISLLDVNAQKSQTLTRADSYWGLHFDRHAQIGFTNIGSSLTESMIDSLIKSTHPDFIQVDSKGHPGISSYPSMIGQKATSYEKDPLLLFRKVTKKYNVQLYAHYSGVKDLNYVKLHPDQARIDENGMPDKECTSLWGNYTDNLLIPQLTELALTYKLDGAWVDGEAWAVEPDYNTVAITEFKNSTGFTNIPRNIQEPNYKEFLEFNRLKFQSYLRKYTNAIHKVAPNFQITSNWAFSGLMPEAMHEDIKLDFLSGDIDPEDAINSANWESRCLASRGKTWDLLSWGFIPPTTVKSYQQLCQEAASVISMGGAYQVYYMQNDDLSLKSNMFKKLSDLSSFVLLRKEFCKGVKTIPQIGLFYSNAGWKHNTDFVYKPAGDDNIKGILNALLDSQNSVNVILSSQLIAKLNDYPVIVIPDWEIIEDEFIEPLKQYVKNGGNLLVIGAVVTRKFDDILGVEEQQLPKKINQLLCFENEFASLPGFYYEPNNILTRWYNRKWIDLPGESRDVRPLNDTKVIANFYSTDDTSAVYRKSVSATVRKYGKGRIAGVYSDLGIAYRSSHSFVIRDLLSKLVSEIYSNPLVKVKGSHEISVIPTTKKGNLYIQLINTAGNHANPNTRGFDEIPILQNIEVNIRTNAKPKSVKLQPDDLALSINFSNGITKVVLPKLKIQSTIVVEK
jgi:hypothetical protein